MKLALVQSEEEIKFIKSRVSEEMNFVPLNLESQTYLIIKKYNFINPKKFIRKDFHEKSITYVQNELEKLSYKDFEYHGIESEFKGHIRFVLNYTTYLIELLDTILNQFKVDEIIISGWDSINIAKHKSSNVFVVSRIIKSLNINKKITVLDPNPIKDEPKIYDYEIDDVKINNKKKTLVLNSVYYNFFRVILLCKLLRVKPYVFEYQKFELNFLKKIIFKILGLKIIKVRTTVSSKKKMNIKNVKISYKNRDISEIVNFRVRELEYELTIINNKIKALKTFLKKNFFNYYFTNVVRGFDGAVTDILNSQGTKTVCISHGTVAKSFNEFDILYKKTISEAVFSGPSKFFAVQSKICEDSLTNTNAEIKNTLNTGNLLFANTKAKQKNLVLFATTLKPLHGTQLLGVEMYYEFLENLVDLNNLSIEKKIKISTNVHGSHRDCIGNLKKIFPNIYFECKKIDKILKKTIVTISYSSSVIEDSINSRVPVILFDKWKRYKHCDVNINNNFYPIFYVNDVKELYEKIEFIKNNYSKLDFKSVIIGEDTNYNIKKLFKNLEK
jgi:hypothetical protein